MSEIMLDDFDAGRPPSRIAWCNSAIVASSTRNGQLTMQQQLRMLEQHRLS